METKEATFSVTIERSEYIDRNLACSDYEIRVTLRYPGNSKREAKKLLRRIEALTKGFYEILLFTQFKS